MRIDPKNLIPVKAQDIKPGAVFYLQKANEEYERCVIEPEEIRDEIRAHEIRCMTVHYASKGLLFVNRNAPFKSISL